MPLAAVPQPTEEEVRRRLAEVLARPEFSPQGRNTLFERVLRLVFEFLRSLGGLHDSAPVLYWLLLVGCLVLLALLVAHIAWTVRRVLFTSARPGGGAAAGEQRGRLSLAFRDEARRLAEQADYTEAIRCLFLALVYRFDESGRVNFQQAYTNREYLALFADRPTLQQGLKVFVDTLDDYWYGQRPTERFQYESCLALYDSLSSD